MTIEAIVERPRLPFWRTVGQAYALWGRNFSVLVRASWLWLLLLTPFLLIEAWLRAPHDAALLKAARSAQLVVEPALLPGIAALVLSLFVMLPAAASIAVAWHRLVLRNERPRRGIYLRFDSIVVGYVLFLAVIWVPGRAIGLLMTATGRSTVVWIGIVASFVLLFIVPRISLALPATALGRNDVTFGAAWRATGQNTWRMFWANLICFLPTSIVGDLALRLLPLDPSRTAMTLADAALDFLTIPLGMIPVGMLSVAYRHFFERSE